MELQSISNNNIIDTTSDINIEKYKENLSKLIEQSKEKRQLDKFVIIRNDDFFPENYEWRVNSRYTNGEYRNLIRYTAPKDEPIKKSFFDIIFKRKSKEKEEVKEDVNQEEILMLYYPVEFRSTKHFTVNTALGMTGEYNLVDSNRKFTIIDDIDNFLNSGYAYSLSEKDAYLDITHEPLKISEGAMILISIDTYNEIKDDKEMMENLSKRKFYVYKGELSLAINMLLSENGILPFRSEYQYDEETKGIIETSLRRLCVDYNLEYARPHGMAGHFTSYIDQYDYSSKQVIREFVEYINKYLGTDLIDMSRLTLYKESAWSEYIEEIGLNKFKQILDEFNKIQEKKLIDRKKEYMENRKGITPEISKLFKDTISLIKEYENEIGFISDYPELTKIVLKFYLSPDIESQVEAAITINNYFRELKEEAKVI